MVAEIAAGIAFGSMALLADGLHMASHAVALGISAFAYIYARRHAHDARYAFGTGKVNALGGFTGAVLLAVFSLIMAWESVLRMLNPVDIAFNQAIAVAVLGLIVNGVSVFILGHEHDHADEDTCRPGQESGHQHHHHPHHHDHNLRAAYLHVLADALTSLLAIFALLAGKYFQAVWLDPVMGIIGALLVARWSWGLLQRTAAILLDRQAAEPFRQAILDAIQQRADTRVTDLHVWSIGANIYAAELVVVAKEPLEARDYRQLLPHGVGLVHTNIEIHRVGEHPKS
jgi:cation diffusion facilitator family transporter